MIGEPGPSKAGLEDSKPLLSGSSLRIIGLSGRSVPGSAQMNRLGLMTPKAIIPPCPEGECWQFEFLLGISEQLSLSELEETWVGRENDLAPVLCGQSGLLCQQLEGPGRGSLACRVV